MWIKSIDAIEMLIDKFLIIIRDSNWLTNHAANCSLYIQYVVKWRNIACIWRTALFAPVLVVYIVLGNVSVNWSWNNSIGMPLASAKLSTMICVDQIEHTNSLKCVLTIKSKVKLILLNIHCELFIISIQTKSMHNAKYIVVSNWPQVIW